MDCVRDCNYGANAVLALVFIILFLYIFGITVAVPGIGYHVCYLGVVTHKGYPVSHTVLLLHHVLTLPRMYVMLHGVLSVVLNLSCAGYSLSRTLAWVVLGGTNIVLINTPIVA